MVVISLLKVFLYLFVGFILGAALGYVARQAIRLFFAAAALFASFILIDIFALIDTGVDWFAVFNALFESIGFTALAEIGIQFIQDGLGIGIPAVIPGATQATMANPLALLLLALYAIPFLKGFSKAFAPD